MSEKIHEMIVSNDFLCHLLNNMSSAVFIVDKEVRVQNVNQSFTKLFQKSEEDVYNELCGNAIGCVFPVTEETDCGKTESCKECQIRKNLVACLTEKGGALSTTIEREFFIGDTFIKKYFFVTTQYFQYEETDLVLVMIYDATELEEHRRQLIDLNEIKNQFLGMAAHDLRNPIASIISTVSLLTDYDDKLNEKQKKKLFSNIQNSSYFMLNLVENLLDISQIESGNLTLYMQEYDLVDFIKEVLEFNKIMALRKNIRISFNEDISLPKIKFDKDRIKQVLNNLIGNAIKFSPNDSHVQINLEKLENKILIKIVDHGPGIPKEEQAKLFKKFQRTSVLPTNGEKGTGLGLAISKKMVEMHGGIIGVDSVVGKGSTFYFSLPL